MENWAVGLFVGLLVGLFVGEFVGVSVGVLVGLLVGETVGLFVGDTVGLGVEPPPPQLEELKSHGVVRFMLAPAVFDVRGVPRVTFGEAGQDPPYP
jgi:hypothetical protein